MDKDINKSQGKGDADIKSLCKTKQQIPAIVKRMLSSWNSKDCFEHISPISMPLQRKIIDIIHQARRIIFPGYFTNIKLCSTSLEYYIGNEIGELLDKLTKQIDKAMRHDCRRNNKQYDPCINQSFDISSQFIEELPQIAETIAADIRSASIGDPAVKSCDEVIFCYPSIWATLIYRLAHELYKRDVPIIPRIMTEYAHAETGIDIHPGATIGEGFFIDHGTGVVIGETTIIGNNVRLYQGVTLGALSLPRNAGEKMKNCKRHPTVEDNVIIYANTVILGGNTVIGENAIIGGNNWITKSVVANAKIV